MVKGYYFRFGISAEEREADQRLGTYSITVRCGRAAALLCRGVEKTCTTPVRSFDSSLNNENSRTSRRNALRFPCRAARLPLRPWSAARPSRTHDLACVSIAPSFLHMARRGKHK